MLEVELWVYVDLNFEMHDLYSFIFLSKLVATKNPAFS